MPDSTAALASALARLVGADHVITDPDRLLGVVTDWTGRFRGATPALVRPGNMEEVVAVVTWCAARGVAIVPQGGNTGMVGGATPMGGEIVVQLGRLRSVLDPDPVAGQLSADAGVTVAEVHEQAHRIGWRYAVDLGARDSATIGGTIATNAGGLRVLRYGNTRQQVLGVQAVTGTGGVVGDLRGLIKDNTGYHLPSLLCGSEGTLAIVTRARLALVPIPTEEAVALLAVDSLSDAVALVAGLRRGVGELSAVELFTAAGLRLVTERLGLPAPFPAGSPAPASGAYVLVEVAGGEGAADRLTAALGGQTLVRDAAVAADRSARARLWRYREGHTEAINSLGVPHKLDVTVPLPSMAAFAEAVTAAVLGHRPNAQVWLFGHAGDGNLHVNITGVDPADESVDEVVFAEVVARGGSISAEHGIGRAKRRWLGLNRTPSELSTFAAIKHAFDPAGILNPGVLISCRKNADGA